MIETFPLLTNKGQLVARTFGPYRNEEEADNYIRVKRERHLENTRLHFKNGGTVENDKHVWSHPDLQYRFIPAEGYFSRYLAQIMMTAMGGVVRAVTKGSESVPWKTPDDEPGIEDHDLLENDKEIEP